MIRHIQEYYLKERNSGLTAAIAGVMIFAISIYIFQTCEPAGFLKGFSYTLCCLSLLMVLAGLITVIFNNYRIRKTSELRHMDETSLREAEITRMEKVMSYSYTGGIVLFAALSTVGLALAVIASSALLKGVGAGMMVMGILGLGAERVSMLRNSRHLQNIRSHRVASAPPQS